MTRAWILPVFLVMLAGMLAGALGRDLGGLLFFLFCSERGMVLRGEGVVAGGLFTSLLRVDTHTPTPRTVYTIFLPNSFNQRLPSTTPHRQHQLTP